MIQNKTIQQLIKVSRRIPRVRSRFKHRLDNAQTLKLTGSQVRECHQRLAGCAQASQILDNVIASRNIFGPAKRDSRPLKVQKAAARVAQALIGVAHTQSN